MKRRRCFTEIAVGSKVRNLGAICIVLTLISMGDDKEYKYVIRSTQGTPNLRAGWNSREWANVESVEVANFRPEGSDHRPATRVKMQYDSLGLYGLFHVKDRYVKCAYGNFNDPVYKDSCVEFFVQPDLVKSVYFNFEFNCAGTLLANCNNFRYDADGAMVREKRPLQPNILKAIKITHSIPDLVEEEIEEPIDWELGFFIPFSIFEEALGPINIKSGQEWKGNFYKCGSGTSHPHWASWSPVDELNFHLPHCFGELVFE